jgi:hypothetical protein
LLLIRACLRAVHRIQRYNHLGPFEAIFEKRKNASKYDPPLPLGLFRVLKLLLLIRACLRAVRQLQRYNHLGPKDLTRLCLNVWRYRHSCQDQTVGMFSSRACHQEGQGVGAWLGCHEESEPIAIVVSLFIYIHNLKNIIIQLTLAISYREAGYFIYICQET